MDTTNRPLIRGKTNRFAISAKNNTTMRVHQSSASIIAAVNTMLDASKNANSIVTDNTIAAIQ